MITTETSNPNNALAALRLVNKARQCAKRDDVVGLVAAIRGAHNYGY